MLNLRHAALRHPQGTPRCCERSPRVGPRDCSWRCGGSLVHHGIKQAIPAWYIYIYLSGWVVWFFFIFPYIGNNHPNWLTFFKMVKATNYVYTDIHIYIYIEYIVSMINWSAGFASWDRFTAPSPRERRYGIVDPHTLWAKATFIALGMTDPHSCSMCILCIWYIYIYIYYNIITIREPSLAVGIG